MLLQVKESLEAAQAARASAERDLQQERKSREKAELETREAVARRAEVASHRSFSVRCQERSFEGQGRTWGTIAYHTRSVPTVQPNPRQSSTHIVAQFVGLSAALANATDVALKCTTNYLKHP